MPDDQATALTASETTTRVGGVVIAFLLLLALSLDDSWRASAARFILRPKHVIVPSAAPRSKRGFSRVDTAENEHASDDDADAVHSRLDSQADTEPASENTELGASTAPSEGRPDPEDPKAAPKFSTRTRERVESRPLASRAAREESPEHEAPIQFKPAGSATQCSANRGTVAASPSECRAERRSKYSSAVKPDGVLKMEDVKPSME